MMHLDQTFDSSYDIEVLHEFPPAGKIRLFYYPGASTTGGHDGVLVRVTPKLQGDSTWLGMFAFGQLSSKGMTGLFTLPDSRKLCVLARGSGYIVDSRDPIDYCMVAAEPVFQVGSNTEAGLLFFVDYLRIVAYGADGLAWKTARLSWDGIDIHRVTKDHIYGSSWSAPLNRQVEFVVDMRTGTHQGGASSPS